MTHRPPAPDQYASPTASCAVAAVGIAAVVLSVYAIAANWSPWITAPILAVGVPTATFAAFVVLNRVSVEREARGYYDRRPPFS